MLSVDPEPCSGILYGLSVALTTTSEPRPCARYEALLRGSDGFQRVYYTAFESA